MTGPTTGGTKLTPELQGELCSLVELGLSYKDACMAVGICKSVFHNWRRAGEDAAEGPHRDFVDALEAANVAFKIKIHRTILENRSEDAQYAKLSLELLTRRFPDEYSEKRIYEHHAAVALGPALDTLTDDQLQHQIEKLLDRRGLDKPRRDPPMIEGHVEAIEKPEG